MSASSQAGLLSELSTLGTNLLTVTNGQTLTGQPAELPDAAPRMIGRIGPVTDVQYTGAINGVAVNRSQLIPSMETNALSRRRPSLNLPETAGTRRWPGARYLNAATAERASSSAGRGRPRSAWA